MVNWRPHMGLAVAACQRKKDSFYLRFKTVSIMKGTCFSIIHLFSVHSLYSFKGPISPRDKMLVYKIIPGIWVLPKRTVTLFALYLIPPNIPRSKSICLTITWLWVCLSLVKFCITVHSNFSSYESKLLVICTSL